MKSRVWSVREIGGSFLRRPAEKRRTPDKAHLTLQRLEARENPSVVIFDPADPVIGGSPTRFTAVAAEIVPGATSIDLHAVTAGPAGQVQIVAGGANVDVRLGYPSTYDIPFTAQFPGGRTESHTLRLLANNGSGSNSSPPSVGQSTVVIDWLNTNFQFNAFQITGQANAVSVTLGAQSAGATGELTISGNGTGTLTASAWAASRFQFPYTATRSDGTNFTGTVLFDASAAGVPSNLPAIPAASWSFDIRVSTPTNGYAGFVSSPGYLHPQVGPADVARIEVAGQPRVLSGSGGITAEIRNGHFFVSTTGPGRFEVTVNIHLKDGRTTQVVATFTATADAVVPPPVTPPAVTPPTVTPPVINPPAAPQARANFVARASGSASGFDLVDLNTGKGVDLRWLAFDEFRGSISVATGDVTGDGAPDIFVGAGPGGGPRVVGFDGVTGARIRDFFAYDPRFTGGVTLAIGDINGDGLGDLITGAGPGGGPHVKVFSGAWPEVVLHQFMAYHLAFTGGVNVAAGDVNGDGRDDVITGAGPGGGPHVRILSGTDYKPLREFMAYDLRFTGGVSVATFDINGDGREDVITGAGNGGGRHVTAVDGASGEKITEYFNGDPWLHDGVRVLTLEDYSPSGDPLEKFLALSPDVFVMHGVQI